MNFEKKRVKFLDEYNLNSLISESDVELKVVTPILNSLGYSNNDIFMRYPVSFKQGREKIVKEADMILKKNNVPYIVIENKKITERITDDIVSQLDSYAFGLSCKYGIVCNGKTFIIRTYLDGNQKVEVYRTTVPEIDFEMVYALIGKEDLLDLSFNKIIEKGKNKQAQDFSTTLKRIHKSIRDTDKLDPTGAFDGWSKLLFMKIYEEKWTEKNNIIRFDYMTFLSEKRKGRVESYINETFMETKKAFPKVFEDENETIGLSIEAIGKILEELDGQKILDIPYDIKGKAFEIFLSSTFRGKGLGQFFTPRHIVDMMVNIVEPQINDTFLDPACGTGGFLIRVYNEIANKIENLSKSDLSAMHKTKEELKNDIKINNFFGIDAEPRAAKTAKMNMIMWGDGENVFRGNGLGNISQSGEKYPFGNHDVSLILANPPFGATEKEKDILKHYNLYMEDKITKTECLFVERAINCLNDNGKLAIVLPDSILGSNSMKPVRNMIKNQTTIKAIISLPPHTFSTSGVQTINTSVIFLEKKPKSQKTQVDYPIFMAVAQNIGYDPTGRSTIKKGEKTDLDIIADTYKKYSNNEIAISNDYVEVNNTSFIINSSKLVDRIDSRYYWFINELQKKKFSRLPLADYIDIKNQKIAPASKPTEYYDILTVSNKYGVFLDEDDPKKYNVLGEEFNQKYKVIKTGDIVYNPYRINVGSIGIVNEDYDNKIVSGAYVVFRTKNGLNSQALLALFKHPFYKMYIDILSTGSIRNNFSDKNLKEIYIPKELIGESYELNKKFDEIVKLNKKIDNARKELEKTVEPFIF